MGARAERFKPDTSRACTHDITILCHRHFLVTTIVTMTSNGPIIISVELAMASTDTAVDSDDDFRPPRQKRKKEAQGRFASPKKQMDEYKKAFCPQNTY